MRKRNNLPSGRREDTPVDIVGKLLLWSVIITAVVEAGTGANLWYWMKKPQVIPRTRHIIYYPTGTIIIDEISN